jgi:DNA-binding IclR family transcriptional regulator
MDAISEETGETVHLSVTRGDRVVQVAQVNSTYLLGTRDWTDVDVPAHCSALGKVFLAWGSLALPKSPLARSTEATITSLDALRHDGQRTRERGWAVTVDELELGLTGVAVPVFGMHDDAVAALGISGPTTRLEGRLDELGQHLLERARELSALLQGSTQGSAHDMTHTTFHNEEVVA